MPRKYGHPGKTVAVKSDPLMSMWRTYRTRVSGIAEVLEVRSHYLSCASANETTKNMKDQNWRALMDDRKSKVQKRIAQAQYIQHVEENERRHNEALELLLDSRKEMDAVILEITEEIKEHDAKGVILKQQAISQRSGKAVSSAGTEGDKQKGRAESVNITEDLEDGNTLRTPQLEEWRIRKTALSQRLRENRIVLHHIHFLLGDVYHILGEGYGAQEDEAYSAAESLRKQLLKRTYHTVPCKAVSNSVQSQKKLQTRPSDSSRLLV